MRSSRSIVALSTAMLALTLLAFSWSLGSDSSAQQGSMYNCPSPGKWSIAVWEGPDGTAASDALATCGEDSVAAAYSLDPQTGAWSRWFAGKPGVSNLPPLSGMQGVLALGSPGPVNVSLSGKITFIGLDGNVWVADLDADSSDEVMTTMLTGDGSSSSPQWSPDGTEIAFVHEQSDGARRVEIMNADGANRRTVVEPVPGFTDIPEQAALLSNVRWSDDGCTLYVHVAPGPVSMHPIHSEPLCGGSASDSSFVHFFDNRADGVFAWCAAGGGFGPALSIGLLNDDAPTLEQEQCGPIAWSPDGERLAFRPGSDIRILSDTGSLLESFSVGDVTDAGFFDHSLDWSPDSQLIVYETNDGLAVLSVATDIPEFLLEGSQPHWIAREP